MPEEVIYKRGQPPTAADKRIEPILQSILADDMQVALARQIALMEKINQHWEKTEFEGKVDPLLEGGRLLLVTDQEQAISLLHRFPNKRWISGTFHCEGPNTVYIKVDRDTDWTPVRAGRHYDLDFGGSPTRIELLRFRCDPGETANLTVIGIY
jgi:hypothetical protein